MEALDGPRETWICFRKLGFTGSNVLLLRVDINGLLHLWKRLDCGWHSIACLVSFRGQGA